MKFSKMQGCGNHFVVIDAAKEPGAKEIDWPRSASFLLDRCFGVAADGLMIVTGQKLSPQHSRSFDVDMYNPDGSPMGMCGNGIRCVARFVAEAYSQEGAALNFTVQGRTIETEPAGEKNHIRVNMGAPEVQSPPETALEVMSESFRYHRVSMGNPHCVIFVDHQVGDEISSLGPAIENHSMFPGRTNVEFVRVVSESHLEVRVWERGAGLTKACGTGACAAVVAGVTAGKCEKLCRVSLPGGDLFVEWHDSDSAVFLTGPADFVFSGTLSEDLLAKLYRR